MALGHGEAMDTADEIEEREDNDGNSAFYNTRTQVWGWTREEVEENIEVRARARLFLFESQCSKSSTSTRRS